MNDAALTALYRVLQKADIHTVSRVSAFLDRPVHQPEQTNLIIDDLDRSLTLLSGTSI